MKILYIHQYFKTREGTSSTRSYEFAKKLVEFGHEVTMLTGDSRITSKEIPVKKGILSKTYIIDGINVIAIKNSYSNYMGTFRRIFSFFSFLMLSTVKSLFLEKHDVVFATSTPLTVGIPALTLKLFRRIPYVFEVRDLWPEAPIQMGIIKNKYLIKILKRIEKMLYRYASHIIALSPGMVEGVLKHQIPESRVSMIPNSCDLELFSKDHSNPSYYINKYGIRDKFVLIHPGSMGKANGLQYIVEAARILKEMNNERVKILLTGDGQTRPLLESYCKEHLLDNVIFTGSIAKKEMPHLIAATDITITSFLDIPILATNSPNKFFDSLAAGKPIIVNSSGWTKNIVVKERNGFYVNPKNPKALAVLLNDLSENSGELVEMGYKSRKLAESKFDRNVLAEKLEHILVQNQK